MFAQIALVLLLSGSPQVQYDPQEAMRAEQFNGSVQNTKSCLYDDQKGLLYRGFRDRKYIVSTAAWECGIALKQFMMRDMGRPEKEVDAFIKVLAEEQLNFVLAEGH